MIPTSKQSFLYLYHSVLYNRIALIVSSIIYSVSQRISIAVFFQVHFPCCCPSGRIIHTGFIHLMRDTSMRRRLNDIRILMSLFKYIFQCLDIFIDIFLGRCLGTPASSAPADRTGDGRSSNASRNPSCASGYPVCRYLFLFPSSPANSAPVRFSGCCRPHNRQSPPEAPSAS